MLPPQHLAMMIRDFPYLLFCLLVVRLHDEFANLPVCPTSTRDYRFAYPVYKVTISPTYHRGPDPYLPAYFITNLTKPNLIPPKLALQGY